MRLGVTTIAASTSKNWWLSFHSKAIPPWLWLVAFDEMILYPDANFVYLSSVILTSVSNAHPTPVCAKPLAADANPKFQPQRMFHVAIEKVPLSPDRGDAAGCSTLIDITVATARSLSAWSDRCSPKACVKAVERSELVLP